MARPKHSGWQADVTWDGQRHRPSGFATKLAAEVWELQALAALKLGKPLPPAPAAEGGGSGGAWSLHEMFAFVQADLWSKSADPSYFTSNVAVIEKDLGPDYPAADLASASGYEALKAACLARGNSGRTINKKASIISKALKHSIERGKLTNLLKPQFPRQKQTAGRERILTREEETACLAWLRQCDPEMADWFVLGIDTGFRSYSEGLHIYPFHDIKGRDLFIRGRLIDDAPNVVDLSQAKRRLKTGAGKSRVVGLTARSFAIVEERKRRLHNVANAKLFDTELTNVRITRHWNLMKEHLGITDPQFVPYSLRHTFGTRMILAGETVPNVATLMGHSKLDQTWKYVHLAGLVQKDAVSKLEKWQEEN